MSFEYKHVKEYLEQRYRVKEYFQEYPNGTVRIGRENSEGLTKEE